MAVPTIETLARRLDRLERENLWLKRAGVVALAVIAAVGLMGQATRGKTVEAEEFVVKDKDGEVHATLGMVGGKFGAQLIRGGKGFKPGIDFVVTPEAGPLLRVRDKDSTTILMGARLVFTGKHGKEEEENIGLSMSLRNIQFLDKTGKVIWSAPEQQAAEASQPPTRPRNPARTGR